ncbi:hypothetical protein GLOTRDRAFT_91356 [Gloeophyllum trabeum ATCC 11539]|uniref:Uncharacterized protein n=1 Tax=Gloeophyllum trabeum (strain ATCC 11539 / FP-39264 / Madison 617) TaxID=670483 RepID=S7QCW3_GLOTA|nr:uncharacterized protein GLOTRDRAFT_91356 [Gloeophyllum trabeum ATCC 11539]EPQ57711.1 hypothetical protein GLOTRDRAFT_91356 [Gloeophyllum trabeum ATCC 11539]
MEQKLEDDIGDTEQAPQKLMLCDAPSVLSADPSISLNTSGIAPQCAIEDLPPPFSFCKDFHLTASPMDTFKRFYHILTRGPLAQLSGISLARFRVAARYIEAQFPEERIGIHIRVNEDGVPLSQRHFASAHINSDNTVIFSVRRGKKIVFSQAEVDEEAPRSFKEMIYPRPSTAKDMLSGVDEKLCNWTFTTPRIYAPRMYITSSYYHENDEDVYNNAPAYRLRMRERRPCGDVGSIRSALVTGRTTLRTTSTYSFPVLVCRSEHSTPQEFESEDGGEEEVEYGLMVVEELDDKLAASIFKKGRIAPLESHLYKSKKPVILVTEEGRVIWLLSVSDMVEQVNRFLLRSVWVKERLPLKHVPELLNFTARQ